MPYGTSPIYPICEKNFIFDTLSGKGITFTMSSNVFKFVNKDVVKTKGIKFRKLCRMSIWIKIPVTCSVHKANFTLNKTLQMWNEGNKGL